MNKNVKKVGKIVKNTDKNIKKWKSRKLNFIVKNIDKNVKNKNKIVKKKLQNRQKFTISYWL